MSDSKPDPRFAELDSIHAQITAEMKKAIAKSGVTPACGANCPACCSEPVYADRIEAERILAGMTPDEIEALKPKLAEWLKTFYASGMAPIEQPNAYQYRELRLPCPLLGGTQCGVYDHTPMSCRMHFAMKHRSYCEDNTLRHQQKFAFSKEIGQAGSDAICQIHNHSIYDHLCVLLDELVFGPQPVTGARLEVIVQ